MSDMNVTLVLPSGGARAAEVTGDQHLHVAAGVLDAAFFEIAGAAIDGFQNGAHS